MHAAAPLFEVRRVTGPTVLRSRIFDGYGIIGSGHALVSDHRRSRVGRRTGLDGASSKRGSWSAVSPAGKHQCGVRRNERQKNHRHLCSVNGMRLSYPRDGRALHNTLEAIRGASVTPA